MSVNNLEIAGVYGIKNLVTGRIYIGSSKNIKKRGFEHKSIYPEKNIVILIFKGLGISMVKIILHFLLLKSVKI